MNSVITDFNARVDSVSKMLSHIEEVSSVNGNVDITVILKSSFYIALYNNIEATIYSILERVHEEIHGCEYKSLTENIKCKFVSYHFGNGDLSLKRKVQLTELLSNSSIYFPHLKDYQKVKTVFSGNLDCQEIRNVFKSYGIRIGRARGNPEHLLRVKNKRNKIAHGEQSLSEAGLQVTNRQLKEMHKSVELSLTDFIGAAQFFISERQFSHQN